jgi:hypothetical protein
MSLLSRWWQPVTHWWQWQEKPLRCQKGSDGTQDHREGFCEIQWVNSMPLLLSYNHFVCLQVDTIIQPKICNIESKQVIQTISHPLNPNHRSRLPAWEHQLPWKYDVASSPGSMSLSVDIEIEAKDIVVKWCTQALVDCGATRFFIDIEWAKLNNIPICPLTNAIPGYNGDSTENEARMITEITDLVLCHENHSEHTQFAVTHLGKQSIILGYNWLHNHNLEINWQTKEVGMSRCPLLCSTYWVENKGDTSWWL